MTLSARIRRRELSAREAVGRRSRRIAALDGELRRSARWRRSQALADADAIDRRLAAGEPVGPLAGVPVAIKDLISTRGLRTTFGSPLYRDNVPDEDDIVVERLRAAGAIVVGKTNTSEFGYGAIGHNSCSRPPATPGTPGADARADRAPVRRRRSPGMLPLALGSDGGGSVRVPAGLTGTFGIKPSWGRVPVYPGCRDETRARRLGLGGARAYRADHPHGRRCGAGALGAEWADRRRPALAARRADLTGPTWRRRSRDSASPFPPISALRRSIPEVAAIAEGGRGRAGAGVRAQRWRWWDRSSAICSRCSSRWWRSIPTATGLRRMAAPPAMLSPDAERLLATEWTADDFTDAILERKRVANRMSALMERYDLLLTPTAAIRPFRSTSTGRP